MGVRFTVAVQDMRSPQNPGSQATIRKPVGVELPLPKNGVCYGAGDIYEHYVPMEHALVDPALRRAWYYLEGNLFGMRTPRPEAESYARPCQESGDAHIGSPFATFLAAWRRRPTGMSGSWMAKACSSTL